MFLDLQRRMEGWGRGRRGVGECNDRNPKPTRKDAYVWPKNSADELTVQVGLRTGVSPSRIVHRHSVRGIVPHKRAGNC